ncbi:hypothetical protein MLD38_039158 [Melastoma candidum]|uniref:Uncharacterized protein n=1 Tax=Melastoma candidum TaxID=119954 RepID=A0ACB9L2F5_9MYRT|nr:hypothetical protein MLD38_039158 [Melastoma candidum]
MSFCKKGLHSFLSFTSLSDTTTTQSPSPPSPPPPPPLLHKCQPGSLAIGLASATGDALRPPNVLESATVGPPPPPMPLSTPFHSVFADGCGLRKDTNGFLTVGFFEEVGEVVDGLMSCTESLGFESSDERRVDEGVHDLGKDGVREGEGELDIRPCVLSRAKRREESERMRDRKFPPPITSLNDKGRPSFFLRALRRDGRLELAEVRIDRPEILRASRADGRLRLEFIKEAEGLKEDVEESSDTIEITEEEEREEVEEEETATTTTSASEEEGRSKEWKVAVSSGEGFGRCHEMVGHGHGDGCHHHNDLHVWRRHCVTIR